MYQYYNMQVFDWNEKLSRYCGHMTAYQYYNMQVFDWNTPLEVQASSV